MREIYSLLHKAAHKAPSGVSIEQLAEALGVSKPTMNMRLHPDYPERGFRIEDMPTFVRMTGDDAPLHFLCEKCGGEFVRMPEVKVRGIPVHMACMDAVEEFGRLMTECSAALADGRVSAEESDRLAAAGYKAIHEILRLLKTAANNVR